MFGQAKVRIQDEKIIVDLHNLMIRVEVKVARMSQKNLAEKFRKETLEIAAKITDIQTKYLPKYW